MKKLLLFYVMSTLLIGCSSDDDDYAPLESFIPGTWKMTNIILENGYEFDQDEMKIIDLVEQTNCYQNEIITFNQDGTATVNSNSFLNVTASLVEGTQDEYTYTTDCVNENETYPVTWSMANTDLLLTEDDGFISRAYYGGGNFFTFSIPDGFEILLDDGTTIHAEEDMLVIYERQ